MRPARLLPQQRTRARYAAARRKPPRTYRDIVSQEFSAPVVVHRPECARSLPLGLPPAALPGPADPQHASIAWKLRPTNQSSVHLQVQPHNPVPPAGPWAQNANLSIRRGTLVNQNAAEFHSSKALERTNHKAKEYRSRELGDGPFRAATEAPYCAVFSPRDRSRCYSSFQIDPSDCWSSQADPALDLHSAIPIPVDYSRDSSTGPSAQVVLASNCRPPMNLFRFSSRKTAANFAGHRTMRNSRLDLPSDLPSLSPIRPIVPLAPERLDSKVFPDPAVKAADHSAES